VTSTGRTLIESLGVYHPPRIVSTQEVLRGCRQKIMLPLEKLTGIKYRRMAGEDEFSFDLASKAVEACLANSRYRAEDIDLLICCNISRYDGPNRFSFEPNTSIKLKAAFGFDRAIAFDLTNACAGIFTGIQLVNALISAGIIQRGMVVSGEYITHLTKTAQREIDSPLDQRLACLTLGDSGAALVLEKSPSEQFGFHDINLRTFGQYSDYCVARISDQPEGGAIMYTDMVKLAFLTINEMISHYDYVLTTNAWSSQDFQHIVMHQTSRTSIQGGIREFNKRLKDKVFHEGNVIDNLAERGNTSTTSHFVAIMDSILNNRIQSGDTVCFCIFASGLTVGTAVYTFDDLPDRLSQANANRQVVERHRLDTVTVVSAHQGRGSQSATEQAGLSRIRIESVGTARPECRSDTFGLANLAVKNCFEQSTHRYQDVDVLIFAGIYRTQFISEPAIAAFIAGELENTAGKSDHEQTRLLAFDIFGGGLSFMYACYVGCRLIQSGQHQVVMAVTSEIENNADIFPEKLLGIEETGSAMILDEVPLGEAGFGSFAFKYDTTHIDAFDSYARSESAGGYLEVTKSPELEEIYLTCICQAVAELLEAEKIDLGAIKMIIPPQISSAFIARLSEKLGSRREQMVDVTQGGKDLFTSSLVYGLQYLRDNDFVTAGDLGLLINVGAGVQVGCATYYF